MRRIKLFRKIANSDDDPRVREARLREENTWLREENTRLELEFERIQQKYSAARAGLRDATGCETPSPRAQERARAMYTNPAEGERSRGMSPQQREFNRGLAEGQRERESIENGRGNVLDIRENVIRRETTEERLNRRMVQLHRDTRRKQGLIIFVVTSLFVTAMLYMHPIILTWILNWEIK